LANHEKIIIRKERIAKRGNCVFQTYAGGKMIEETSMLLVTLGASMLTAAFTYYAFKYRRFIQDQASEKTCGNRDQF